jgi:hypothetical protein
LKSSGVEILLSSRICLKVASIAALTILAIAVFLTMARQASASTYVVYIPLDSPIYDELETLDSLGYIPDYIDEIKPVSRIEAARLTIEARVNLDDSPRPDTIARDIIHDLREQLREEVGWLQANREDNPPTAILHPLQRAEVQYIYSDGPERFWRGASGNMLYADEGTPLLPNNDGIATATGSNEVARWGAWGGVGGFLSAYGEAAVAGPVDRDLENTNRVRPMGAEAVADWGNWALSFGQEEVWWGPGYFSTLSQSTNANPIPGFRLQNVHPKILPFFLRYLGQFRFQTFFGRLDAGRVASQSVIGGPLITFARPFIDGQILSFRTLPNFEWGITHTIMFGGHGNSNYGWSGFFERATSINTGNPSSGNTNSQAGVFLKFRFPRLRDSILWVQTLGEDNLSAEVRPIGGALPFLAVSYMGGYYLPRLTEDGRNDFRFEWKINEPDYQTHSDALYWAYSDRLMDDPLGPNASELDVQPGHWFSNLTKGSLDLFFTDRAPKISENEFVPSQYYGPTADLHHERSVGMSFDMLTIPQNSRLRTDVLAFGRMRLALEYCEHMNYGPPGAYRALASLTIGVTPTWDGWSWTK